MKRIGSDHLSYIELIEIAEKYFSGATLDKKFPFVGIKFVQEGEINGARIFKLSNSNIANYIVARNLVSKIRNEDLEILSSIQTSYHEDIFIAKIIEQESHNPQLLKVLTNHYDEKISKLFSVNSVGILSKIGGINDGNFIQNLINFTFANDEVMNLYYSAVIKRVLGDDSQKKIIYSKSNLKKLYDEIEKGYDPIAIIFCLKMISSQESYPRFLQVFSSRYNSLSF